MNRSYWLVPPSSGGVFGDAGLFRRGLRYLNGDVAPVTHRGSSSKGPAAPAFTKYADASDRNAAKRVRRARARQ